MHITFRPTFSIAFSTILMLTVFSQCLSEVTVPLPGYNRDKGFIIIWFHLFKLFPVSNSYLDMH
jgi:nucleobase transporter 1/2